MSPAWHAIEVPDAPPKIAQTLAGLGSGVYDGQVGIIRLGAYPDVHTEEFLWSSADNKWIGTQEYIVLSALDGWAMDWSRQPLSRTRSKWCRPNGGVSWQIVGQNGSLVSDVTLPQASIQIEVNAGTGGDWAAVGQFLLRDVLIDYTGYTIDDATHVTFTGCTNLPANDGRTFDGTNHTAAIPFSSQGGGDQGGWGTAVQLLDRAAEMWTAGFRLEERLDGFFNGTTDLTAVEFAPFYLNADLGEDLGAAANFPGPDRTADQVPGLLGPGVIVTGPAYDMAGYTAPGSHKAHLERGFERRTTAWTAWSAAAPTKRILQPILYARHAAATKSNGECYSVNLSLRWVSP